MRTQWLVAGSGLALIVPWAALAITWPGAPSPAVVAIPALGPNLNAMVAPSLGSAPFLLIVDLDTAATTALENPSASDTQALGLRSAFRLLDERAGTVLARTLSAAARNLLHERGVRVFATTSTMAADALEDLRGGTAVLLGPPVSPLTRGGNADVAGPAPACVPQGQPPVAADAGPVPPVQRRAVTARSRGLVPPGVPSPSAAGGLVGAQVPTMEPSVGLQLVTVVGVGAQVVAVAPNSRAEWAGFQPGDIIVRLGQTVVRSAEQLRELVAQRGTDRDLLIRVLRNNGAVERLLVLTGVGGSTVGR